LVSGVFFFYLAIATSSVLFVLGLISFIFDKSLNSFAFFIASTIPAPLVLAAAYAYKTIAVGVLISRDLLIEQEQRRIDELNKPKED
jgi:hypothetical protein